MSIQARQKWDEKIKSELPIIRELLSTIGVTLDEIQPNLIGEKFLMKTDKFVLNGVYAPEKARVIVKISNHKAGIKELEADRHIAQVVDKLSFSTEKIKTAKEYFYGDLGGYRVMVQEFLDQPEALIKLKLEDQYYISMRGFSVLESFYLAAKSHYKEVKSHFPILTGKDYLKTFSKYLKSVHKILNDPSVDSKLDDAYSLFKKHLKLIDKYSTYLVHEDFVPHNFRIYNNILYFIDHEALRFGNKYESWARYVNWMLVQNPPMEEKLVQHVQKIGPEDYLNLRMMRLLKCAQLITYYAETLAKTSGDTYTLNLRRFNLWLEVLVALTNDRKLHSSFIEEYKQARDVLRTDDEKQRQKLLKIT